MYFFPHRFIPLSPFPFFSLLCLLLFFLSSPKNNSADAYLWFRTGTKYNAQELSDCRPERCGINYTSLAMYDMELLLYNRSVDNASEFWQCQQSYLGQPKGYECRCFAVMEHCLEDVTRGNCSQRLAQQYCWDFWGQVNAACSWKLCLSGGGVDKVWVLFGIVMIASLMIF